MPGIRLNFLFLYLVLTVTTFFFISCGRQNIDIKGFDQLAWRKDVRSCQNIRPSLLPALQSGIPQLMGLSHTQIIAILGKPEGNSLEKSGERVYYYFVEPGQHCQNNSTVNANKILIRFDALDRVYKVRLADPLK